MAFWDQLIQGLATTGRSGFASGFRYALLAGFVAFLVTLLTTPVAMKLAHRFGAVDDPTRDERRVHTKITPRWGGLSVWLGIVLGAGIVLPSAYPTLPFANYVIGIFLASLAVLVLGLVDDVIQLSAKVQMVVMIGAGVLVQFFVSAVGRVQISGVNLAGNWIEFGLWAIPLTAIYIFVVTKTMDTIDGIDGLSSGIAAISAGTISVIGVFGGQPRIALLAMAVCGACLGFLRYNYHPAKIFLGGGAPLIGFLLGSLSVVGTMKTAATLTLLLPLFLFGIPLFDAAFVVIRRMLSGSPITSPDKRHVHHTLLNHGFTQKQTVWILYLVAFALCGAILFMVRLNG
jgi:UDP-GlcNAc:undecaprenyl-phosphate GlcNAc-1-phosphate transferase